MFVGYNTKISIGGLVADFVGTFKEKIVTEVELIDNVTKAKKHLDGVGKAHTEASLAYVNAQKALKDYQGDVIEAGSRGDNVLIVDEEFIQLGDYSWGNDFKRTINVGRVILKLHWGVLTMYAADKTFRIDLPKGGRIVGTAITIL